MTLATLRLISKKRTGFAATRTPFIIPTYPPLLPLVTQVVHIGLALSSDNGRHATAISQR
jgi:hypothetical protein